MEQLQASISHVELMGSRFVSRVCVMSALLLVLPLCISNPATAQQPTKSPSDWLTAALDGSESKVQLRHIAILNMLNAVDAANRRLQLVWIVIPSSSFSLQVQLVNKIGPADELYKIVTPPNAILTIDGGFYALTSSNSAAPLGLVVENRKTVNPQASWTKGGVIYSTGQPGAKIALNYGFHAGSDLQQCIQSRPMLLQGGEVVVSPTGSKSPRNRMAIGTTANGDLFIAAALADDLRAINLYDFARFLSLLRSKRSIVLKDVVNLDGANDAHLFSPGNSLQLGYHGTNYVPDVISILPR